MVNINEKYNNWTVIGISIKKGAHQLYFCKCNCGRTKELRECDIKREGSQYCSKCRHASKKLDIGSKHEKWTIIEEIKNDKKRTYYKVQCECGTIKTINLARLRLGDSKGCRSCGSTKHGLVHSRTYSTWESMIQRCTNPKQTKFKDYGGRGIKVCDMWLKFENFLEDMGERPENLELDRKDNDGNYEPSNCRWATRSENLKNRRSSNLKK